MGYFDRKKRQFDFRNPKIYQTTKTDNTVSFNRNYFVVFLAIVVIGIIIWWLFYSSYFQIKNISIEGTLNEDIRKEIESFKGRNILLFVIGQKDKELAQKQSSIDEINIIKGIPDTLKVEVLVRKPVIRWKTKDKIYFIDQQGVFFQLDNPQDEDNKLPLITDLKNMDVNLGKKSVSSDFVDFISKLSEKFNQTVGKEFESIGIDETTLYVDVKLNGSYLVYFSTMDSLDQQLKLLKIVMDKHNSEIADYVDLRVSGKAYYK